MNAADVPISISTKSSRMVLSIFALTVNARIGLAVLTVMNTHWIKPISRTQKQVVLSEMIAKNGRMGLAHWVKNVHLHTIPSCTPATNADGGSGQAEWNLQMQPPGSITLTRHKKFVRHIKTQHAAKQAFEKGSVSCTILLRFL
mmetsp:Transcript_1623/g.2222  ORF Transcript_1623/g.2222 Transcript_1623/m.2222 type:complete len:144 (+) Transcript_1623:55-486(+)